MGTCCGCETDATLLGINALKSALEGQTKMVQPDPRIDPEVYVTFLEISAKEGAAMKWSPAKFTMRDITFKTSCEVVGSRSQLAAAGTAKGVGAASAKMGASQETTSKVVGAVVGAASTMLKAKDAVKDKLGIETSLSRVVKVDVTVDLVKEFGAEQVAVTVKDVHTKLEGGTAQDWASDFGEKMLSSDRIRGFLERAISEKATEVATRMAKAKTDAALAKVGVA
mmetsp:Transcript_6261/g.10477  ORF Transcript_6261/g.10477 Transcript_6261/m.10477 type:complete len:225 (-) Transcript_6261:3-677(-)